MLLQIFCVANILLCLDRSVNPAYEVHRAKTLVIISGTHCTLYCSPSLPLLELVTIEESNHEIHEASF